MSNLFLPWPDFRETLRTPTDPTLPRETPKYWPLARHKESVPGEGPGWTVSAGVNTKDEESTTTWF